MCVGLFSTIAHAETLKDFTINLSYKLYYPITDKNLITLSTTVANNSTYFLGDFRENVPMDLATQGIITATIANSDGSLIAKSGEPFELTISGISAYFVIDDDYYAWDFTPPNALSVALVHTDGTWTYLYDVDWSYSSGSNNHSIKVSTTANKDVRKLVFSETTDQYFQTGKRGTFDEVAIVLGSPDNPTCIEVEIENKEVGLLKSIGDKLTSGFSALGDKLTNVFNSIVELPQKLWNLISDGLKSLFVPSEESMTAYKDKWDELLASRFGAVYQVVNIMTDSWDGIMQADETDTIEFPQASINLSGTPFTFGGYNVKIVPDGFGVLVTAIKSIVAIVCTVAFVNGMRKRYDEIMGVEQ